MKEEDVAAAAATTPPPRVPSAGDALQKKQRRNARDRQRSQLKKSSMAAMRTRVAQLQAEKQQLEQRFPGVRSDARVADPPLLLAVHRTGVGGRADAKERLHAAQTQYLAVLQQIEQLREQNRAMALDVLCRDLFRSATQNLLDARANEVLSDGVSLPPPLPPPPPLDDADASALAHRTKRLIAAARLESERMPRFTGARVFGWSDFRCRTGSSIQFTIRKTLARQSARLCADKTWALVTDAARLATLLPAGVHCDLRELQRVGRDAVVFDRTTHDRQFRHLPRSALRTTYMLVRSLGIDGRCSLGMKTIDRPAFRRALAEGEAWCDVFYWFHVEDEVGADGEPRTAVVFGGALSYFTEAIARAWLAELVFLAVRWESSVVAPVLLR